MPMATGDESVAILLENTEAKQKHYLISDEDLAWADSCLIKDPEISETNLDSLKDVLLDILDSHSGFLGFSAAERDEGDGLHGGTDTQILPSVVERESSQNPEIVMDEIGPTNESGETNSDSLNDVLLDILDSYSGFLGSSADERDERDGLHGGTNTQILPFVVERESSQNPEIVMDEIGPTNESGETNSDSLKDVLLDILDSYSGFLGSSAAERDERDDLHVGTDTQILPSVVERESSQNPEIVMDETSPTSELGETNIDDGHLAKEDPSVVWSLKKAFLPTYKDEMREIEYSDSDSDNDFGFPKFVMEASTVDIFKVWDLDIPFEEEEDEFVKQLNTAHSESSTNTTFDSGMHKGLKLESLDNLVEGIANLSLNGENYG